MTYFRSRINDLLCAEEDRLAHLKIFCEAHQINFYSAKEEIAKVCNDYGFWPNEIQERFFAAINFNLRGKIDLGCPWFWDLVYYRRNKL